MPVLWHDERPHTRRRGRRGRRDTPPLPDRSILWRKSGPSRAGIREVALRTGWKRGEKQRRASDNSSGIRRPNQAPTDACDHVRPLGFGGDSKQPQSVFHESSSYSSCVITLRMKTFRLRYRTRVTSRNLLPPMLKTTQFPTRLAEANAALTSDQDFQSTERLLTWECQARSGPSAVPAPRPFQNARSRDLEITRTIAASRSSDANAIVVRKMRTINGSSSRNANYLALSSRRRCSQLTTFSIKSIGR